MATSEEEQRAVDEIMAAAQPQPQQSQLNSLIDVYDSEIIYQIEPVIQALNSRAGTARDLEAFRQEIIDRFADMNFRANVNVYTTTEDGTYAFDITIVDRINPVIFDPEKMAWEVQNDILDFGEGGVVTEQGYIRDRPKLTVIDGTKR